MEKMKRNPKVLSALNTPKVQEDLKNGNTENLLKFFGGDFESLQLYLQIASLCIKSKSNCIKECDPVDSEVSKVLSNERLRKLLSNESLRKVLTECGSPSKLRYYLQHPKYGTMIRQLKDAGLVQFQV
mmetsp:Transcript_9990/g.15038  ORF Transcript_9990/g.15038 Transcript_9990/m.15038 type:complete len:128 (+) Transcript_9990:189-572(+)